MQIVQLHFQPSSSPRCIEPRETGLVAAMMSSDSCICQMSSSQTSFALPDFRMNKSVCLGKFCAETLEERTLNLAGRASVLLGKFADSALLTAARCHKVQLLEMAESN